MVVVALHWSGQVAVGSTRVQKLGSGCVSDMHPTPSPHFLDRPSRETYAAAVVVAQI